MLRPAIGTESGSACGQLPTGTGLAQCRRSGTTPHVATRGGVRVSRESAWGFARMTSVVVGGRVGAMEATLSPVRSYPVRVEGHLDEPSRWLWLLKWLLAIPHYVLLAFLWIGFVVCALAACVVLPFTGRYPRGLFAFSVGVLRWSWRVAFYAYGANGTDRYPPFTLDDVPDYPARLEVEYPEHQRRGLPLIGWWLLGIPQYVIAGVFIGGGGTLAWTASTRSWGGLTWIGLIGALVLVGAVVLLFRGVYPRSVFDLVIGLNRWALRVVAYAALMTPEYPPFQLDAGEDDLTAAGTVTLAPSSQPSASPDDAHLAADADALVTPSPVQTSRASGTASGAGRVVLIVIASIAALIGVGLAIAGATAIVVDQTQRDADGYVMTDPASYSTSTYALVSDSYRAGTANDWFVARDLLSTVRIRVHSDRPVFIGIAPEAAVNSYLAGVAREEATGLDAARSEFRTRPGGPPSSAPTTSRIWVASATGSGDQILTWTAQSGNWRIVLMNAAGTPNVAAELSVGARFPHLLTIGIATLGAGILILLLAAGGVYWGARRRYPISRAAVGGDESPLGE